MIKVHQILKSCFKINLWLKHAIILLQLKQVNRVKRKIVRFITLVGRNPCGYLLGSVFSRLSIIS